MSVIMQVSENKVRLVAVTEDETAKLDYNDLWVMRTGAEAARHTPRGKPTFELKSDGVKA